MIIRYITHPTPNLQEYKLYDDDLLFTAVSQDNARHRVVINKYLSNERTNIRHLQMGLHYLLCPNNCHLGISI